MNVLVGVLSTCYKIHITPVTRDTNGLHRGNSVGHPETILIFESHPKVSKMRSP